MNPELTKALQFDPVLEAEKRMGVSYKEDERVVWASMALMHEHAKEKNALLFLNNDTSFDQTLEQFMGVLSKMRFDLVLEDPIPNTQDKLRILWGHGVLICFDSYWDDKSVNGGKAYFNYQGPWNAMHRCSSGFAGKVDGQSVWLGDYDVREGLRNCLQSMEEKGTILETWVQRPFLWLLDYNEPKVEGYDYKAITESRIARLPEHIIKAITPA